MKKLLVLLALLISVGIKAQTFPPKTDIVNYINQVIKNNPQTLIRGDVMNRILKEVLNYPVDTVWIVGDTLKYRQNGSIFNRILPSGELQGVTLALRNLGQGVTMASLNPSADTLSFKRLQGDSTMVLTVLNDSTLRLSANTRHPNIQFQDEGVNLGDSGSVVSVDFTGAGVTASRSGRKVTVVIPGGGGGGGGGSDGNNFPTAVNVGGGTLTISRDGLSPISTLISTADIAENPSAQFFTTVRARQSLSSLAPVIYNSGTGQISVDTAVLATKFNIQQVRPRTLVFDSASRILTLTLNDNSAFSDTLASIGDNWGTQIVNRDQTLFGNGTLAAPLRVDTNRLLTINRFNFKLDSLSQFADTLMFYRIEGTDSIYLQINDEIYSVLDSTGKMEISDEGVPVAATNKINFVGSGVTTLLVGDELQVQITGGGGGGAADGNNYPTGIDVNGDGEITLFRLGLPALRDTISTTNVPEGSRLYFTTPRARGAISAAGPITYNSTLGVIGADTTNTIASSLASIGIVQKKIDSLGAISTVNIYNSNGTLTGNRTVTMGNFNLLFSRDIFANELRIGRGAGNIEGNVVLGPSALLFNSTGSTNTAVGYWPLRSNSIGSRNTALGFLALTSNTSGSQNTGIGEGAGRTMTVGNDNTFVGSNTGGGAFSSGSRNLMLGSHTGYMVSGSDNTYVGTFSGDANNISGNGNIFIGNHLNSGITGSSVNHNTIIGVNIGGLTNNISNNIIISDGQGNQRFRSFASGNVSLGYAAPTDQGFRTDVGGSFRVTGAVRLDTAIGLGTRMLVADAGGNVFTQAIPAGGGGGSVTASNGLTAVGSDVRLGGALTQNTFITSTGSYLDLTGNVSGGFTGLLRLRNTESGGITLNVRSGGGKGAVIEGSTDGFTGLEVGGFGLGNAIVAYSANVPVAYMYNTNSSNGTPETTLQLVRFTSTGNGTNGIGSSITLGAEDNSGTGRTAVRLTGALTDVTSTAALGEFRVGVLNGVNGVVDRLRLANTGQLRLHAYGANTFSGTATYLLGVDGSGNVIETSASGGSYTAKSTLGPATFWAAAYDVDQGFQINEILSVGSPTDNTQRTITINAVMYVSQGNFTGTGQWVQCGLINTTNFRPNNTIITRGNSRVLATRYENASNVAMVGSAVYSDVTVRIDPNGQVLVWVDGVNTYPTLSGTNQVVVPIHVTYFVTPAN